jgi:DNA (cytosine-5)-methyltransferase 1
VEIEPYCRKVLLQRQRDGILPKFPIWDDVRTFDGKPWRGKVDVVCGGFPCTDIAVCKENAEGIDGERSGLWGEMRRVIGEVRPRYAFIENSPMLTSRGGVRVVADLAGMGFDCRWGIISASDAGANHLRKRIWIVADSKVRGLEGERDKPEVYQQGGGSLQPVGSLVQKGKTWWSSEPVLPLLDDGVAHGMDRLKASGNGQVPAVVKLAWETLS